jgi:uncharacterized protein (DUF433 family)
MDVKEILKEYPELTEEDIREAIRYASQVLSKEEVYEISTCTLERKGVV